MLARRTRTSVRRKIIDSAHCTRMEATSRKAVVHAATAVEEQYRIYSGFCSISSRRYDNRTPHKRLCRRSTFNTQSREEDKQRLLTAAAGDSSSKQVVPFLRRSTSSTRQPCETGCAASALSLLRRNVSGQHKCIRRSARTVLDADEKTRVGGGPAAAETPVRSRT